MQTPIKALRLSSRFLLARQLRHVIRSQNALDLRHARAPVAAFSVSRNAVSCLCTAIAIANENGTPDESTAGDTGVSATGSLSADAKYPASGPHTTATPTRPSATARTMSPAARAE